LLLNPYPIEITKYSGLRPGGRERKLPLLFSFDYILQSIEPFYTQTKASNPRKKDFENLFFCERVQNDTQTGILCVSTESNVRSKI
jgi:hypothetical protein